MKFKPNKKQIVAAIAVVYIVIAAFFSRGEIFYVESDVPLEDIVVKCDWVTAFRNLHGGTHSVTQRKALVVKSGEKFSCGLNWFAGITLSFRSSNSLMHPTHIFAYVSRREDEVRIMIAKSKLEMLDEQKAKFESGYWSKDKYMNPGAEYARSLIGCGFPYQYFDYYREVKKVDREHFKKLYHDSILACYKRTFLIRKNFLRGAENYPDADEYIEGMWNHESWSKWNE